MKRRINLVVITLLVLTFVSGTFAQIKLDTGYDAGNLSYYNVNQTDGYWIMKKNLGAATAQQANIIVPNSAWKNDLAPAKWINAYPTNSNTSNGEYEFERCFCLKKGFSDASMSIKLRADDYAEVMFNGNQILQTPAIYSFKTPLPSSVDLKEKYFKAGRNCLTVKLKNIYGVASGFTLSGEVSAIGLDGDANGVKQTFSRCSSCSGSVEKIGKRPPPRPRPRPRRN